MKAGWVELWRLPSGYEFRFVSPNGAMLVKSKTYSNRQARDRGLDIFCEEFGIDKTKLEVRPIGAETEGRLKSGRS